MKEINGKIVYSAFRFGAKALIEQKDYLNAINVFPVPDGDTGTNMAMTVRSILYSIQEEIRVDQMAAAIDNGAMRGARGNSGMILAQYFHGWAESMQGKEAVSAQEMIDGFKSAVPAAYAAVDQPQEGTILTMMRVMAEELERHYNSGFRGENLMERVFYEMKKTLQKTMSQLEPLKRNHVIDSGAAGFLAFVEGIHRYLTHGGEALEFEKADLTMREQEIADEHEYSAYRYCTEGILEDAESADLIRGKLSDFGDSLIVLDRGTTVRFHVHTDDPEQVFARVKGKIVMQKVEDMTLQTNILAKPKTKIAVLTDSIADLDPQWALDHQIHVIPIGMVADDQTYLDRLTMSVETVLQRVRESKPMPTSAVPPPDEIRSRLAFLQSHYEGVLALPVSGKMSGFGYQLKRIAEEFEGFDVEVVDTLQNATSQGLLVKAAAEWIEAGNGLKKTAMMIKSKRSQTKIFVAIHDLKPMIQGGRLSVRVGKVFEFLGIQPIISINEEGAGTAFGMHMRFASSLRHLERLIKREAKASLIRVQVSYSDDRHAAEIFAQKLSQVPNVRCGPVTQISAVVAASAGSGAIAVAYMKEGNS